MMCALRPAIGRPQCAQRSKRGRRPYLLVIINLVSIHPLIFLPYLFLPSSPSILNQAFIAAIFIMVGDIKFLIKAYISAIWVFYGLTFVSLLIMRVTHRKITRPYKVYCCHYSRSWFSVLKCIWQYLALLPWLIFR